MYTPPALASPPHNCMPDFNELHCCLISTLAIDTVVSSVVYSSDVICHATMIRWHSSLLINFLFIVAANHVTCFHVTVGANYGHFILPFNMENHYAA